MPRKRAAASSADYALTGGTGDVNPQWLNILVSMPASATDTQDYQAVPVSRLPQANGRAMVIEILKVIWDVDIAVQPTLTASWLCKGICYLMTSPIGQTQVTSATTDLTQLKIAGNVIDYTEKIIAGYGSSGTAPA